jgi:uncharacterized protein (UPF0147 family)
MLKQANLLIDKAIEQAIADLKNEEVDINYTPHFIIGMLEEIKQVMNTPIETTMDASDIRNFHQMD